MKTPIDKIDFALLKEQKVYLLNLQNLIEATELEGLINLIDSIQDYAVDHLGMPESDVFIEEHQKYPTLDPVILIHRILSNTDQISAIIWSVEDFEYRARELEEWDYHEYDDENPMPKEEQTYNRDYFADALSEMVDRRHDCNYGISWDTIDNYLELHCID